TLVPAEAAAANASTSLALGRVASSEKPRANAAMASSGEGWCSVSSSVAVAVVMACATAVARMSEAICGDAAGSPDIASLIRATGRTPPSPPSSRDHVGPVVDPEPAVLAQHVARRVEIAPVGGRFRHPVVLDLRDVNGGVPGREQRRGADRHVGDL